MPRKSYVYKVITDEHGLMTGRIMHVYEYGDGFGEQYAGSYFEQLKVVPAGNASNYGINQHLTATCD